MGMALPLFDPTPQYPVRQSDSPTIPPKYPRNTHLFPPLSDARRIVTLPVAASHQSGESARTDPSGSGRHTVADRLA
jgi:hypothetical protein